MFGIDIPNSKYGTILATRKTSSSPSQNQDTDPPLLTLTDVAGSAELATQTALDLLLNMSTQRELATGSLQVRAEGVGVGAGTVPARRWRVGEAYQPSTVFPQCLALFHFRGCLAFLWLSCCPLCRWQW